MSKRKLCLVGAVAVIFLAGCSQGTTNINPSPTDVVTVTDVNKFIADTDKQAGISETMNAMDPVKLAHKKHEDAGVKCVICHHKQGNDDRIKQCAVCHKGASGEDTLHNLCINCHAKTKQGPTLCNECHIAKE